MPVRYANLLGLPKDKEGIEVFANRGVCGIDGCVSTALGVARAIPHVLNVLLVGDVTFYHDSKGLLAGDLPKNLRILLLNDQGGGIFRLIDGARQQPELETLFAMRKKRSVSALSEVMQLQYFAANNAEDLNQVLPTFLSPMASKSAVLEVFIDPKQDKKVFFELPNNTP